MINLTPVQELIGIFLFGGLDIYVTILHYYTNKRDKTQYD